MSKERGREIQKKEEEKDEMEKIKKKGIEKKRGINLNGKEQSDMERPSCFPFRKNHFLLKKEIFKNINKNLHGVVRGRIISTPPFDFNWHRFGSGVYRESSDPPLLCFCPDKFELQLVSFFLYPDGYVSTTS